MPGSVSTSVCLLRTFEFGFENAPRAADNDCGGACSAAAACAVEQNAYVPTPTPSRADSGVYKVGNPYQIEGTWYYPREQPDYDETGVASWYGPSFYGRPTANGEIYNAGDITAAHRTLPMPVNVRVTNLDNGKSLVVRVNDRGPYAKGRIIDVSEQAAKLLGFYGQGTARVRVTFVSRALQPNGAPVPGNDTPTEIASAVPAVPAPKVEVDPLAVLPSAPVAPPVRMASLPRPAPDPVPAEAGQPTGVVTQVPVPADDSPLCPGRRVRLLRERDADARAIGRRSEDFDHKERRANALSRAHGASEHDRRGRCGVGAAERTW